MKVGGEPSCRAGAEPRSLFSERSVAATVTLVALLLAAAWQVDSAPFAQGISSSWLDIPELKCIVDKLAVLTHSADYGMFAHKCQHFLLGRLTLDECSKSPEVIGP